MSVLQGANVCVAAHSAGRDPIPLHIPLCCPRSPANCLPSRPPPAAATNIRIINGASVGDGAAVQVGSAGPCVCEGGRHGGYSRPSAA